MRSRALRLTFGTVSWIAIGAAAVFLFYSEQQLGTRRTALGTFDERARETSAALADLRLAQAAYVAAGQGADFWTSKVDSTAAITITSLNALRETASSEAARATLRDAETAMADFSAVDKRIRGYLASDTQLMAADIIFSEGAEAAARTGHYIERARLEEHQATGAQEAARRTQEASALGAAGGLVILVIGALMRTPARTGGGTAPIEHRSGMAEETPAGQDLSLRYSGRGPIGHDGVGGPAADLSTTRTAAALRDAAQVCTDLGRVNDPDELNALMERAASVLDASGLMLWLGTARGAELRPALAHGYSAETVARMSSLPRSANNAAAAAYRTGTLQIVLSRPGSPRGAIVAPVLSADGCIGVLSAEVRDGSEASDTVQALAAIFAAQLAGVLPSAPATMDRPAESAAM
jgi:hypothetical protein